jgi:two-component system, chemotaxis family, response regulator PixG
VDTNILERINGNNLSFRDLIFLFKEIKAKSLSGNLIVQLASNPSWMFSFNFGQLAWISGGIDSINRWQRNLEIVSLDLPADDRDQILLKSNLLAQRSVALEVLFDIIQICQRTKNKLSYQLIPIDLSNLKSNPNLPLQEIEPILSTAIQSWQEWEKAGLADYFPSRFPTFNNSDRLSEITSLDPAQLSALTTIDNLPEILLSIDGTRSLRNLAIYHRQHLLNFTTVLLPLLKSGSIELSLFASSQLDQTEDLHRNINVSQSSPPQIRPLIACIDDSILVYKNLEKFLTEQCYRSYGVQNPLKIISTLIKNKPDLIFLDLLMPISNGYEICEQIRKTPSLKDIPVIMLTAKDGLFDRMHSKFVGANDFLGKPISHTDVLRVLDKYIK